MKKTRNLLIILLLSALVILGLTSQVKAVEVIENVEELADAFETIEEGNVQVTGKTLKLLKNITIDTDFWDEIPFVNGFEGTIDLNGHTISAESKTGNDYCVVSLDTGAKLTVEDSSSAKTGKVNELYFGVLHENSALTVNGGTFTAEECNDSMFWLDAGALTINGGNFVANSGIIAFDETNVTINNANFKTNQIGIIVESGKLTIKDGTFTAGANLLTDELNVSSAIDALGVAVLVEGTTDVTIDGGHFSGLCAFAEIGLSEQKAKVVINGGDFTGDVCAAIFASMTNNDKIEVNGGTFEGNFCAVLTTANGLNLKGGQYTSNIKGGYGLGAVCTLAETEEAARSILAKGYKYNNDTITKKEIKGIVEKLLEDTPYEDMELILWSTENEVKVIREKYNVTIAATENGKVGVDKTCVAPGEEVKIVAEANEGYEVDKITVKTASGEVVEVSNNAFVMPIDDVVVSATFKTVEKPVEPKEPEEKDDTPKTGCAMPNMLVALFAVLFK